MHSLPTPRFLIALALALAFLLLPLGGCVESEDVVTLKMDGSGTVQSRYETDLGKYREMLVTLAVSGLGNMEQLAKTKDADLYNMEHPAWARKFAAKVEGYEITTGTQEIKDKKRSTLIESKFTTMALAAKGGAFSAFNVELSEVKKSEAVPAGGWKFVITSPLAADPEQTGGMDLKMMLPMFEAQLDTLKTSLKLVLPTKILETNGKQSADGMSVSWTYTFDDLMDTDADATMTVVFKGAADLKLKPFKQEADFTGLTIRAQQMPPKDFMKGAKAGATKEGEKKAAGEKAAEDKPAPEAPVTTPSTPKSPPSTPKTPPTPKTGDGK